MASQTPFTPTEVAAVLAARFGVTENALGDLVTYDRTGAEPRKPDPGAFKTAVAAYGPADRAFCLQVRDRLPRLTDDELIRLEARRARWANPDPAVRRGERRSQTERARHDVGVILRRWLPTHAAGRYDLPAVWGAFKAAISSSSAVAEKYPDAPRLGRTHFYEELMDAVEALDGALASIRVVQSVNRRVLIIEAD